MIQARYLRSNRRRGRRTGTAGSAVARCCITRIFTAQDWCCRRGSCGITAVSRGAGWRVRRIRLCSITYTAAACAHGSRKRARDDQVKITSIDYSFQHVDFLSVSIGGLFIRGKVFLRARCRQDCSAQKEFFFWLNTQQKANCHYNKIKNGKKKPALLPANHWTVK